MITKLNLGEGIGPFIVKDKNLAVIGIYLSESRQIIGEETQNPRRPIHKYTSKQLRELPQIVIGSVARDKRNPSRIDPNSFSPDLLVGYSPLTLTMGAAPIYCAVIKSIEELTEF